MSRRPAKNPGIITVRNLEDSATRALKQRAARHGRSMEEEARVILRAAAVENAMPALRAVPVPQSLAGKTVLLVIGGGIAAYKSLDLIRRLRERGAHVRAIMTKAAQEFVTPLSVGALTASKVFTDLFDREDEQDVGHIRLAREASAVVVAPATADLMARMASGRADDLATAVLLATRAPVLLAPAMNPMMWSHPATQRNQLTLAGDGVRFVGPATGEMAESGEAGTGRMCEPLEIVAAVAALFARAGLLAGRRIIVTSGPTHEPIDPVRYLANRSSGKQGHAIAGAAAAEGADVTLISGPVALADPPGVRVVRVETARAMLDAVIDALPADVAIMAAAVADWRTAAESGAKIKKGKGGPPSLALVENLQRADLNALDEAHAFRRLIDEFGLTQEQVAQQVGRSRAAVTNTLRVLAVAPALQDALRAGRISEGHARALAGVPDHTEQERLLTLVEQRALSVRQTEQLVRQHSLHARDALLMAVTFPLRCLQVADRRRSGGADGRRQCGREDESGRV